MPDTVLALLKVVFLLALYLFLARVVRAVWVEIFAERRTIAESVRAGTTARGAPAADPAPASSSARETGRQSRRAAKAAPALRLKMVEPPAKRGALFDIADEMTVGRAAGCAVCIDDTFASQLHARVFRRDGAVFVEDLGSTNGTFLNRKPLHGPMRVSKGDRLQIGNTVLEVVK